MVDNHKSLRWPLRSLVTLSINMLTIAGSLLISGRPCFFFPFSSLIPHTIRSNRWFPQQPNILPYPIYPLTYNFMSTLGAPQHCYRDLFIIAIWVILPLKEQPDPSSGWPALFTSWRNSTSKYGQPGMLPLVWKESISTMHNIPFHWTFSWHRACPFQSTLCQECPWHLRNWSVLPSFK